MEKVGYYLYLIFTASWFLHLTARIPALGAIHFDLVLVAAIVIIYYTSGEKNKYLGDICYNRLKLLFIVIICITPFAEWPGSVLRFGLPNFVKGIVFFFFTVWFLTNEKRVKIFLYFFVLFQSFRVVEPLYLHLTQGYWGSKASMANWTSMDRLSGAPFDIVNPNGLAFVILTVIPFFMVFFQENLLWKIFCLTLGPASVYALYLTGSRSGMVGFVVILLIFLWKTKKKIPVLIGMLVIGLILVSNMKGDFADRYLSIFESDTRNAATVTGRIDGVVSDFKVGFRKPIVGHGLGTSAETNTNYSSGDGKISHNIYTETFQEIGAVGLFIFLLYLISIFKNLNVMDKLPDDNYILKVRKTALILAGMNLFFGLASYGLSSYEWYFLGGLSVIISKYLRENDYEKESTTSR